MRYIISLGILALLFAECKAKIEVYPTGSYDTLGVQWMTIERDHITYYFQGTGKQAGSLFSNFHEEAYEKLGPIFDAKLPTKLRFFVWTDWEMAQEKLGRPLGFAVGNQCVCHIRFNQTLGHEMTHILSYWAQGTPPNSYSRFINEGIAVAHDLSDRDFTTYAKETLKGKGINSIRAFWDGNQQNASEELLYPAAGAFIQFLLSKNTSNKFIRLVKNQHYTDAEAIYGKEQLDSYINEFDTILGL